MKMKLCLQLWQQWDPTGYITHSSIDFEMFAEWNKIGTGITNCKRLRCHRSDESQFLKNICLATFIQVVIRPCSQNLGVFFLQLRLAPCLTPAPSHCLGLIGDLSLSWLYTSKRHKWIVCLRLFLCDHPLCPGLWTNWALNKSY